MHDALVPPQLITLAFAVSAGLCLRQAGLVRRPYAFSADLHSLAAFVAGAVAFWAIGFGLLTSVNGTQAMMSGFVGALSLFHVDGTHVRSFATDLAIAAILGQVIAGTLAERIRFLPLMLAALIITGALFPVIASWQWGGGWLAQAGFIDFGGASLVHVTAGAAALAGALVLGGRGGRFDPNFELDDKEHHSHLLALLGTVIVLVGWQGVVAGLRLSIPVGLPVPELKPLLIHLNAAALAGGVIALATASLIDRGRLVPIALNGVIAGLVAISADPVQPGIALSMGIGAVAGLIAAFVPQLLERMRIDDVTDGISAHLAAGLWGTLIASFTTPGASFGTQLLGTATIAATSFAVSFVLFLVLQALFGLRAAPLEATAETAKPASTG